MASDEIAEQLQIQNAILMEIATQLARSNMALVGRDPDDHRRRGFAKSIENNALDLTEQVDLGAVDQLAETEPVIGDCADDEDVQEAIDGAIDE